MPSSKAAFAGCLRACGPAKTPRNASASGSPARLKRTRSWVGWARARARAGSASPPRLSRWPRSERSISSRPRVRLFTTSLVRTLIRLSLRSERDQQYAPAERRDAAAQGLLAPDPVRRAADAPARHGRGARRREREDDGPRTAARRALCARAQGPRL